MPNLLVVNIERFARSKTRIGCELIVTVIAVALVGEYFDKTPHTWSKILHHFTLALHAERIWAGVSYLLIRMGLSVAHYFEIITLLGALVFSAFNIARPFLVLIVILITLILFILNMKLLILLWERYSPLHQTRVLGPDNLQVCVIQSEPKHSNDHYFLECGGDWSGWRYVVVAVQYLPIDEVAGRRYGHTRLTRDSVRFYLGYSPEHLIDAPAIRFNVFF